MIAEPEERGLDGDTHSTTRDPADLVKYKGLFNQGATCYLNSVLQVLFMTEGFKSAVERHACENPDSECIDLELDALFKDLKKNTATTNCITWKLRIDTVNNPRDAAEYFEKILNCASPAALKVFRGALTNRTICSSCRTTTETDVPFLHLPLALAGDDNSVLDSLKEHFRVSHFIGDDQIYCDRCDEKRDFKFDCVMKQCPDVLMLLLRRFQWDQGSMDYVKNNCRVDIPSSLQIPTATQTYALYAVVEHYGDLRNGHYTTTITDGEDWYHFDDTRVQMVDREELQETMSVYLLFYKNQKDDCESGSVAPCSPPADSSVYHQRGDAGAAPVGPELEEPDTEDCYNDGREGVSSLNVSAQCAYFEQSEKKEELTEPEDHGLDRATHSTTCDPADLGKMFSTESQRLYVKIIEEEFRPLNPNGKRMKGQKNMKELNETPFPRAAQI